MNKLLGEKKKGEGYRHTVFSVILRVSFFVLV